MKKKVKILLWQLVAFVMVTVVVVVLKFLMPWFVDSFLIDYSMGVGYLVGHCVPYGVGLLILFFLPRSFGIRRSSLKPEIGLISPIFILFGVMLVFAAQLVVSPLIGLIPSGFMDEWSNDLLSVMESGFWPMFTYIFMLPLFEEWIYRGFFLNSLAGIGGVNLGLPVMALLSGLAEITPQAMLVMAASSFVYGAIYFVKRSLTTVYMIHVLCNGFSYLMYLFFGSVSLVRENIADYERLYVALWTVAFVLLVVTGWWVNKHEGKLRGQR